MCTRTGILMMMLACALAPFCGVTSADEGAHVVRSREGDRGSFTSFVREQPSLPKRDPFVATAVDLPHDAAVQAIVIDGKARALVRLGGKTAIVGVGDTIAQLTVVSIGRNGVVLSDGTRIPLGEQP